MNNFNVIIFVCLILVSYEAIDANGECVYWFYEDSPDKHNPCYDDNMNLYVPDNAIPIWI